MEIRDLLKKYSETPITRQLILELLKNYKRPNDKISELLKNGDLISIRRGLYLPGPKLQTSLPEPFLIANHLRGPSYVTMESALDFWQLIPERTYETISATTRPSKKYKTKAGRFSYRQLPLPYYSYGIRNIKLTKTQSVLIASAEKAICDKIILTPHVNLRSVPQTQAFLIEDLRIDSADLKKLKRGLIRTWIQNAPKQHSIAMLHKTLQRL